MHLLVLDKPAAGGGGMIVMEEGGMKWRNERLVDGASSS
jgi:hypothetical protein